MEQIRTPFARLKLTGKKIDLPQSDDIDSVHPVDELAQIRAELQRLHAREQELKTFLCTNAQAKDLASATSVATVTHYNKKVFDPYLLPRHIQADPKYYRVENRTQVEVQEKPQDMHAQPRQPDMFFITADNIHELVGVEN